MDNTATRNYMKSLKIRFGSLLLFLMTATSPILMGEDLDQLIQEKLISSSVFVIKNETQKRILIIGDNVENADISWLHPGKSDLLVFCYSKTRFMEKPDGSIVALKGNCYNIQKIGKVDYVLFSDKVIHLDKVIAKLALRHQGVLSTNGSE